MDGSHFDHLTKACRTLKTRRAVTRVLAGILASGAAQAAPVDAKRKKHKKPCKAPKQKCGGKCLSVLTDDRNCGACGNRCAAGQTCKNGECKDATPQECQPGACCQDNEVCKGDGRCWSGVCQPKPTCQPNGTTFLASSDLVCCSENVSSNAGTTGVEITCLPGAIGNSCQVDGDCQTGSCIGYQCAGTCSVNHPCAEGYCCTGSGACGACTVFATSAYFGGNLGGLTGANEKCQQHAQAAGLPGVYRAWLSDSGRGPASLFSRAKVPYVLPGGQVVAGSWADLTSGGPLDHAIDRTESGIAITTPGPSVWTNTTPGGLPDGTDRSATCDNWTVFGPFPDVMGRIGDANSTTTWTQLATHPQTKCENECRLYCFQQR